MTLAEGRTLHQDPSRADQVDGEAWFDELASLLPAGTVEEAGPDERTALLD